MNTEKKHKPAYIYATYNMENHMKSTFVFCSVDLNGPE